MTRPTGWPKYGAARKNTQRYYTTKRLIRNIYFIDTSHHFTPCGKYKLNKLTSLPMCGFIAQLAEHRTGIAEVTRSNPVEALIFFRLLLSNSLNWKIYCDDHSSLSSITAFQIWIISYILHITPQYDRRPNCLLPLLIIERLLTERYNNFCYSILGHPNCSLTGASSSSKLYCFINMHVPALCVAYWISRHCVLIYGKYGLLTKCEVKMAGYWPSSFLACL